MLLESFIQYLTSEKHYSAHTVKAYHNDLGQFSHYILKQFDISDPARVEHRIVRSWMATLLDEGNSPRSINRKLSALKTFFRFLQRQQLITESPILKTVSPKVPKKLPEFIDSESMSRVFDEEDFDGGLTGQRNRLVLELLYATGIRASELMALTEDDVDISHGQLRVTGKRNKQRIIPFGPYLGNLIADYINLKRKEARTTEDNKFLILTKKGRKAYHRLIYGIVRNCLSKYTTKTKKSPHVLRHTFATVMLNNGADLNSIKELLGHASLAATQVYTHNTIGRLKKIYQLAHPKA